MIETLKKIPKHAVYRPYRWYLFNRYDHTEAYRRLMKVRIRLFGAKQSVGGFGLGIGQLQYEYMKNQGLAPSDTLLDIGCGTLRGGKYFIEYLEPGNYIGMDISQEAIESGEQRLSQLVEQKCPRFYVNEDLTFREINSEVDYAIAQSLFTHLPKGQIDECLSNIPDVIGECGVLYATINETDTPTVSNGKNYSYPVAVIRDIAEKHGLNVERIPDSEYPHPREQRMLRIKVRE